MISVLSSIHFLRTIFWNKQLLNTTKSIRFFLFVLLLTNFLVTVFGNDNDNEDQNRLASKFDEEKGKPKSLQSITQYKFPQFREVSPCSCDITENKCDIGCCCDKRCQKEYNVNITCMPGKNFYLKILNIIEIKYVIFKKFS